MMIGHTKFRFDILKDKKVLRLLSIRHDTSRTLKIFGQNIDYDLPLDMRKTRAKNFNPYTSEVTNWNIVCLEDIDLLNFLILTYSS